MATVSEILKNARIRQNLTLSQIEQATKIRANFLASLEKGEYKSLPSPAYVRGFVKNYAEFLGLPKETLLAKLRRELNEKSEKLLPKKASSGREFPIRRIRVTGIFLLLILIAIALFSYLLFQYKGFLGDPTLSLEVPSENERVQSGMLTISGRTEPDATVRVNDEFAEVQNDGRFQKTLTLFKGKFTVKVTSTNRFGRQSQVIRTIAVE